LAYSVSASSGLIVSWWHHEIATNEEDIVSRSRTARVPCTCRALDAGLGLRGPSARKPTRSGLVADQLPQLRPDAGGVGTRGVPGGGSGSLAQYAGSAAQTLPGAGTLYGP